MGINSERLIFLVAFVWFLCTAIFSEGYLHHDEHFQILEYANSKFETNEFEGLAWEYDARIRSAFQPYVALQCMKTARFFGVENPFVIASLLRLLSALISFIAVLFFIKRTKIFITQRYHLIYVFLSYFLWCIPFLYVRFSSESWSAALLLVSCSFLLKKGGYSKDIIIASFLLGVSFLCRFQIGICVFGIFIWLAFYKKESFSKLALFLAGIGSVIGMGCVIDFLFYGDWNLTAWNYLYVNLVEGRSSDFGKSPFYFYLYSVFRYLIAPVGFLILLSSLSFLWKSKSKLIFWVILPFFLIHSLIPHKELRFLIPLLGFVPFILVKFIAKLENRRGWPIMKLGFILVLGLNVLILGVVSFHPVGNGNVHLVNSMLEEVPGEDVVVYYTEGNNPLDPLGGLYLNFYVNQKLDFVKVNSIADFTSKRDSQHSFLFIDKTQELELDKSSLSLVEESYSSNYLFFKKLYKYKPKDHLLVYRLN